MTTQPTHDPQNIGKPGEELPKEIEELVDLYNVDLCEFIHWAECPIWGIDSDDARKIARKAHAAGIEAGKEIGKRLERERIRTWGEMLRGSRNEWLIDNLVEFLNKKETGGVV